MFGPFTLRTKCLIALAVGCAGWIVMMPESSPIIEPTHGPGAAPSTHGGREVPSGRKSPVLNASLRLSDRIVKDTTAASLFSPQSWYVAPPAPPPAPVAVRAPAVPTAPPLPFAFMGSYRTEGAGQTFFLTAGDRVYDVKVGDTLDNTYSVDGMKSGRLLLTYMPLKIQQSIAVGDE
ncbi:MAG: hypothetical protein NVS1B6_01820 [Steroidobacteraceae bacterium]